MRTPFKELPSLQKSGAVHCRFQGIRSFWPLCRPILIPVEIKRANA
jgi:hypothetical protein